MKRKLWIFALLILALSLTLISCSAIGRNKTTPAQPLSTPQNVTITDTVISWDAVQNAVGYVVSINDEKYPVPSNMYDLSNAGLDKGNYVISVTAVGNNTNYTDSSASTAVLFEYKGAIYTLQVISEEGGSTSISKKTYNANDVVDLVAYPKEQYHFDGWFSDNYYKVSSNPDFSFQINSDTVLYAQFSPDPELIDKESWDESELMQCSENFSVVVYCPEEDAIDYIKENFFVYDDYFLDDDGKVVEGYEEFAERQIGKIDSRGNNLYVISPAERYQKSGAYVARATGNVSILKEYSRIVNSGEIAAAQADGTSNGAEMDEGIGEMAFSIENTPHVNMRLNDDVYIYSFYSNENATSKNVDGWIVERIGTGLTDEETGVIGGFITESIIVRDNHRLTVGDVVGFGGNLTLDISLDQITESTVFGRVKSITYCGGETVYPVIFVELEPVHTDADVFYELDVYQEGDVDIGDYIEENAEELTEKATAMFYRSDDYHKFLATVATAAESYSEENNLVLLGITTTSSFLDKIKITPSIKRDGNTIVFSVKGNVELEFGKKDTKAIKASGKFTVSFEFTETLKFEYNFSWVKKDVKIWFVKFKITNGIDLRLVTTQDTHFVFDAAVVYTAGTQTGYITNERTLKIHQRDCYHVNAMNEGNKLNTTDTLEDLEKKGYVPCKDCLHSKFTLDTVKKEVHRTGCWHSKQLLGKNSKPSNLTLIELVNQGYSLCGSCLPDAKKENEDYESTENFRKKISESLSYSDWGDKLKEIKQNYENADSLGDSNKDFKIVDIPFNCIVTIRLQVYLSLSFKVEASIHYEQRTTNKFDLGVRATIGSGFRSSYSKEELGRTKEFTLIGKVELKAGIKLEVSVMDPLGLVQLGIYGTCGVYADLAGVLHISTEGENYAAAYFEMGFYYDFGITYNVCYVIKGSVSLAKVFGLSGKVPFLKMGYNKVVYAYANDVQEVLVKASEAKKSFSLQELGLMKVKNYTLPAMKTGTETLNPASSAYNVNLKLESGKYFEIDGVNIKVKDNAPYGEEFEDTLTISIRCKDTSWKTFKGDNYILYLPTIRVKLVGANKCQEHVLLYLEAVEADCTTIGYEECLMCSRCQKYFNLDQTKELTERKQIAALGHNYTVLDRIEPTCIAMGLTEGTLCTRCGEFGVEQEVIDPLGHQKSEDWEVVRAPKCTSQGMECNHCVRCDTILDYRPILPTGHTPSTHDPKCEEAVTCTVCAKVLAQPKGHIHNIVSSKAPTCTEPGFNQYKCLNCEHTYEEIVEATGHTDFATARAANDVVVAKEASCLGDGEYLYHCATCGVELKEKIAALGHLVSQLWTTDIPAGCETPGEESHHCMRQGCTYKEGHRILPAIEGGHDWGEWITTKEADCGIEGIRSHVCKRCSASQNESIAAKEHEWGPEQLLSSPSCTEQGHSYRTCEHCGTVEHIYTEELGHDPIAAATCTEDSICRRCDTVLKQKLGHDFVEDSVTPATFETDGVRHYACSRCDAEKEEILYMLKHEWEESKREAATCSEEGYIEYVCHCTNGTCTETKREILPKIEHTKQLCEAVASTCSEKGIAAHYECSVCHALIDMEGNETTEEALSLPLDRDNHDLKDGEAHEATACGEEGWAAYKYCSRCDYTEQKKIKKSHNIVSIPEVPATCSAEGSTYGMQCTACKSYIITPKKTAKDASKHTSLDFIHAKDPTCTEEGNIAYCYCNGCKNYYAYDEETEKAGSKLAGESAVKKAALGHNATHYVAHAATCTETGNYEYWRCERCKINYSDENCSTTFDGKTTIDAQGHELEHVPERAYCEKEGNIEHWRCEKCGALFSDEKGNNSTTQAAVKLKAQGHDYGKDAELLYAREATCDQLGYKHVRCARSKTGDCMEEEDILLDVQKIGEHVELKGTGICSVCGCAMGLTYSYTSDGYTVTGYNGTLKSIKIPTYYKAKDKEAALLVIHIDARAFENKTDITDITIPSSVTAIGTFAFSGCTSLTSVTFSEGSQLTNIAASAFAGCTALKSIIIPDSVTYIGQDILKGCSALEELSVPFVGQKSVTRSDSDQYPLGYLFGTDSYENSYAATGGFFIGSATSTTDKTYYIPKSLKTVTVTKGGYLPRGAFYSCTSLTSIILNNVSEIGESAFNTRASWDSLKLQMKNCHLTYIGSWAFEANNGISIVDSKGTKQKLLIPAGCTLGSGNPFNGMCGLKNDIALEDGVDQQYKIEANCLLTRDGKRLIHAFETATTIPSTVEVIGQAAFNRHTISSIQLPNSITSIENYAFKNCKSLTEITIPSGVTSIGKEAFHTCTNLSKVTFASDSKLTKIGDRVFYACEALTSISIPSTVTNLGNYTFKKAHNLSDVKFPYGITAIGDGVFEETALTTVHIPTTVKTIGAYAFKKCTALTSTVLPYVTSIGNEAFHGCTALASISFPSTLTTIGKQAFSQCTSLRSIRIPKSVTSIGQYAFDACSGLLAITVAEDNTVYHSSGNCLIHTESKTLIRGCQTSVIPTDGSVTELDDSAFWNCTTLTSITIPEGVTVLDRVVFTGCSALTDVTLPATLTSIGERCFENCSELTGITLPASLTSIGEKCFAGCKKLAVIYFNGSSDEWAHITKGSNWEPSCEYTIRYASQGLTYSSTSSGYTVTGIGSFTGKELIIPSTYNGKPVTAIAANAFKDQTGLTSVEIPDSVTSIGSSILSGCSALTSITIPFVGNRAGVTATSTNQYPLGYIFGAESYSNSTLCRQSYYESSTATSAPAAYYIPNSLRSVTVKGGYIPYDGFENCTMLTSITLGDAVTAIGKDAFWKCSGLKSIVISSGVTSIGERAFHGCYSLQSMTLPFIGARAGVTPNDTYQYPLGYIFGTTGYDRSTATEQKYYGSSLTATTATKYYIPNSLTSVTVTGGPILFGAFYGCTYLTTITLSSKVNYIADAAFKNCKNLKSITIPEGITRIGGSAFYECYRLSSVTLPSTVTEIADDAFSVCTSLESITIPASVIRIGLKVFYNCSALASVKFDNATGWFCTTTSSATSGTNLDVSNTSTNATNLKETYTEYYWKRAS